MFSRPSELIIGTVAALLGAMVFFIGQNQRSWQTPSPGVLYTLSGIAACIAVACFIRRSRPVTVRLIGLVLLAAGVVLLAAERGPSPVQWNPVRQFLFAAVLAASGGWLAVTGRYPTWGAHGHIFAAVAEANRQDDNNKSDDSQNET